MFTGLLIKGLREGWNGFCIKSHFYSYYRCFSQRMRDGDAFSDDLELTGVGEWGVLIMVCQNFDFQWEVCNSSFTFENSIVNGLNELNLYM